MTMVFGSEVLKQKGLNMFHILVHLEEISNYMMSSVTKKWSQYLTLKKRRNKVINILPKKGDLVEIDLLQFLRKRI